MKRSRSNLVQRLTAAVLTALLLTPAMLIAGDKPLRLYGTGGTFPEPLYLSWMHSFTAAHPQIQPDYQGLSSARGLNDLAAGRVDYASADFKVSAEDAKTMADGIIQLPMAAAGIVLIYNLPEVGQLELSREAMTGLFSGTISRWNDPILTKANPNARLPDLPITLVARSGASGTSYNLSAHLSAISPDLASRVGATLTPNWATVINRPGGLVRGSGNDGVTALVRSIPGAIGYVAYPYADFTNTPMAAIENRNGRMVAPNPISFAAAMNAITDTTTGAADIVTLVDPPGADAYPIIAVSYLMLRSHYASTAKREAILDIVEYALGPGQSIAERIGYIPFSPAAVELVREGLSPLKANAVGEQ
ncbi:MAG: phosphate ABC transporter substrate-binding protein PstS [Gammaproteobacteria bacterium]|jgi:phosphate transport system substrate-binding protein|nr:phosphate ABC transporter substrate-binding protein PstS [Gammaproteobacteria bacterium]